jgi:hypothetical protein
MIHVVTYLELRPRTTAPALKGVERWLRGDGKAGTLHACWYSNLGPANRILVWRGFDDAEALVQEQLRHAGSSDSYGAADYLAGLSSNIFHEIDFVGPPSPDVRGPLFEVRDYVLRFDGLDRLFDLWRPALPGRLALAPWVTALYSLTGAAPRVLHIYPWASLAQRDAVRDGARAVGWPPLDAPKQIERQESTIYLASADSPIQ